MQSGCLVCAGRDGKRKSVDPKLSLNHCKCAKGAPAVANIVSLLLNDNQVSRIENEFEWDIERARARGPVSLEAIRIRPEDVKPLLGLQRLTNDRHSLRQFTDNELS